MRKKRNLIIDVLFWLVLFFLFLPRIWLSFSEGELRKAIDPLESADWEVSTSSGEVLGTNVVIPEDFRGKEQFGKEREWILSKDVSSSKFNDVRRPVIVLGRVADSDRVFLNSCEIGSTGVSSTGSLSGWWWGALRAYEIPKNCRINKINKLEIHIWKRGANNAGLYAGPIGIGEAEVLTPIISRIEWFRFGYFRMLSVLLLGVAFYYLFVFVLLPERKEHGVFALCAGSIAVYILMISAWPFRSFGNLSLVMKIHLINAILGSVVFLTFLRVRMKAIPKWLLFTAILGGGIAGIGGVAESSFHEVYRFYEGWFSILILCFLIGYICFLRVWIKNRNLWRYGVGYSAFVFSISHDAFVTSLGLEGAPYLIPYGFFAFVGASALALAKESADAFVYVEEQVNLRTQDLKAANEELRAMDKMKQQFFANVSHDFKTPLTVALGVLNSAGEGVQEVLKPAKRNLIKLLGMIQQLLDTVRAESRGLKLKWENVKVGSALEEWVSGYDVACAQKGLSFEFRAQEVSGLLVPLDPIQMQRVIDNVLGNAIKFCDQGNIRVTIRTNMARIFFDIEDSGPGISPEERHQVFNRYYQSVATDIKSHGGSGIGLSFVKEIVELHNGQIWIEDSELGGSKFVIALPLSQNVDLVPKDSEYKLEKTDPERFAGSLDVVYPPKTPPEINAELPNVLVAEDNPDVAQVILHALQGKFNVFFGPNGKEALELLKDTKVDCILSDIMMPVMNGTEFLKAIRENSEYVRIPVIMLTSKGEDSDVTEHLKLGANDYVTKPFAQEVLVARVKGQVDRSLMFKRLSNADKLVTLGLMSTGLAHEMKNPLHSLRNHLSGVRKRLKSLHERMSQEGESFDLKAALVEAERLLNAGNTAQQGADRLSHIITSMQSYASGSIERTEINLREMVEDAFTLLRKKSKTKGVDLLLEEGPEVKIFGYAPIMQVVVNLVDNGLYATEDGGGPIQVKVSEQGTRARISVQDHGQGIPEAFLEKVFDPFESTKPAGEGTGLGLFICQDIIENLFEGEIRVESAPGRGTTFSITVPKEAPDIKGAKKFIFRGAERSMEA